MHAAEVADTTSGSDRRRWGRTRWRRTWSWCRELRGRGGFLLLDDGRRLLHAALALFHRQDRRALADLVTNFDQKFLDDARMGAGTSMVALSDSSVITGSSALIASPSLSPARR